jgi:hypothetical protein
MIKPFMEPWIIDLLAARNDMWIEELAFEIWCQCDVAVSERTVRRLLRNNRLSNKVNTRIASKQCDVQQGLYLEELATILEQCADGEDPMEMLVYVDESACSEKSMFRRRSWSAIGLPAYTTSELVNKARCSVLRALTVNGYMPEVTLVLEGSVT